MNNAQIGDALDEIADILEFQAANPFRVRAYRNGARAVRDCAESIANMVAAGRLLTEIAGIGADLSEKLQALAKTGQLPFLDELRAQVPASVLALLRIAGVGPKKAAALHKELGISTLEELKAACEAQRVRALKGFGQKTEATILAGIGLAAVAEERLLWAAADGHAQSLLAHLRTAAGVERIEAAGSYRRGRDTIGDLDLLVVSANVQSVMDRLAEYPNLASVSARGETKMSVRLGGGLQVDLRVVPAESFGAALVYFTGSKNHNIILRGRAKDRGLKINEYGVYRVSDGNEVYIAGRQEADVYATLDLPWIPPELREARSEFQWADANALPRLIELEDIVGDLHMHTDATDGQATLAAMVAAAQARGLAYIAITDHSQRVSMARGLDPARLRAQWREIDALRQKTSGITVLKGVECDILERGGMDLPDDVLAEADWVVASIHYGQNQSREEITRRVVGAIRNPHVSAIAHPTGRLLNRRKAYEIDLDEVYQAAQDFGKLLELNANPARLDLDDVACARARERGIPIVISTDAHSESGLDVMRYGILQARRAGLTKSDVANTLPWNQLQQRIGKK